MAATLARGVQFLRRRLGDLRPRQARLRRRRERLEHAFDARYGTETSRPQEISRNDVVGDSWVGGVAYQPVSPGFDFASILDGRDLPYHEFSFVDIGAGKGRALLLAAALPFRRLVGVEYSNTLAAIARENVRRAGEEGKIEVVNADAIEYELPEGPYVLFLYNPFDCDVMSRLIANVSTSFTASPRRIVVVYHIPRCAELWGAADFLVQVDDRDPTFVYDTEPVTRAATT